MATRESGVRGKTGPARRPSELTQAGTRVSFDGVIHVPEDETCFFVFGAASSREAVLVAQLAALDPCRVVEAVTSREEYRCTVDSR